MCNCADPWTASCATGESVLGLCHQESLSLVNETVMDWLARLYVIQNQNLDLTIAPPVG